jgi:hypothetical protein
MICPHAREYRDLIAPGMSNQNCAGALLQSDFERITRVRFFGFEVRLLYLQPYLIFAIPLGTQTRKRFLARAKTRKTPFVKTEILRLMRNKQQSLLQRQGRQDSRLAP